MWFILGCGEHPVNTSHAKLDREHQKRKGGLESLAGPVAQWQSTRLITGGAQVRILPGPPFRCRPSPDVDTPHRGGAFPGFAVLSSASHLLASRFPLGPLPVPIARLHLPSSILLRIALPLPIFP